MMHVEKEWIENLLSERMSNVSGMITKGRNIELEEIRFQQGKYAAYKDIMSSIKNDPVSVAP